MTKYLPPSMWRMYIEKTTSPERKYLMYPIQVADIGIEKPVMDMALPGQDYSKNPLLAIQGQTGTTPVSFAIWDDGRDRAVGSAGGAVTTVMDQLKYLGLHNYGGGSDFFFDGKIGTKYKMTMYREIEKAKLDPYVPYDLDTCDPDDIIGGDRGLWHKQECVIVSLYMPYAEPGMWNFVKGCRIEIQLGRPF